MTTGFSLAAARSGFSLVELSIVLVILGLLTGGILTGQNLIRAAELRSVVTQLSQYQTAVYTFRDKYFALPGDITNAEQFWGTMSSGTCPDATGGSGTQTCNGDGNGKLGYPSSDGQAGEIFTFWQHLANSGLIEGTYTGVDAPGGTTYSAVTTVNVPASRISNASISVAGPMWPDPLTGHANMFDGSYRHRILFGTIDSDGGSEGAALAPEEAWNLDTKLDDGLPAVGKLRALKSTSTKTPGCTTSDVVATARYALASSGTLCSAIFTPGF